MKKLFLFLSLSLIGTLGFANTNDYSNNHSNDDYLSDVSFNPTKITSVYKTISPCEAGANTAYNYVISQGGTTTMAQGAYNASLKACEKQLQENGF